MNLTETDAYWAADSMSHSGSGFLTTAVLTVGMPGIGTPSIVRSGTSALTNFIDAAWHNLRPTETRTLRRAQRDAIQNQRDVASSPHNLSKGSQ